jgi:coproporphyrinogen III oxidase
VTEVCGAERPPLRDYGWTCTGIGLVIVIHAGAPRIPVVLPARALEIHQPEPWWETPVAWFTGGDHMHLCVPRRPPPDGWRANGVLIHHGMATPAKVYGIWEAMT